MKAVLVVLAALVSSVALADYNSARRQVEEQQGSADWQTYVSRTVPARNHQAMLLAAA